MGFEERELRVQLSRDLFAVDLGFHSDDSPRVRKLVQMGWRKVAPVDADESESTGVVKEAKLLRANFPDKCIVIASSGRHVVPWDPYRRICGMETMNGADRCTWHGGPGAYTETTP